MATKWHSEIGIRQKQTVVNMHGNKVALNRPEQTDSVNMHGNKVALNRHERTELLTCMATKWHSTNMNEQNC
jgi:hypothetical protein